MLSTACSSLLASYPQELSVPTGMGTSTVNGVYAGEQRATCSNKGESLPRWPSPSWMRRSVSITRYLVLPVPQAAVADSSSDTSALVSRATSEDSHLVVDKSNFQKMLVSL